MDLNLWGCYKMIKKLVFMLFMLSTINLFVATDFESEITLNIKQDDTTCTLLFDEYNKTKSFDKGKHTFDRQFEKTISINCDKQVYSIRNNLYRDNVHLNKFSKVNTNSYNFNLELREFELDLEGDTTCKLYLDGVKEKIKVKGSWSEDILAFESFGLHCEEHLDELEVISEEYYFKTEDISHFQQFDFDELKSNRYETLLFFNDDFDKQVRCDINLDKDRNTFYFDDSFKLSELFLEFVFEDRIYIKCKDLISNLNILIVDRYTNKVIYEESYNETKSIDLSVNNILNPIIETEVEVKEGVKVVEKPTTNEVKETIPTKNTNVVTNKSVINEISNVTIKDIKKPTILSEKSWWDKNKWSVFLLVVCFIGFMFFKRK